jgi:serine/threonine protein kinase
MQVLNLLSKDEIEKILPYQPINELGAGADGQVFDTAEDISKVIKLSVFYEKEHLTPIKHYLELSKLFEFLIASPQDAFASVYKFGYCAQKDRILDGNIRQRYVIYHYVLEKLNKISEDEKKVFHSLICHEDRNINKNYSLDKVKEMLSGMQSALDFNFNKIMLFYEKLKKSRVIHQDLHVRNIMKDNHGNFKLIDLDRCTLI